MTFAVGRLYDADASQTLGTVFAVTARYALTAFHCVGDRSEEKLLAKKVFCVWEEGRTRAVVEDFDIVNDVALLRLHSKLPSTLQPISLTTSATDSTKFIAPGAPTAVEGIFTYAASGDVTWVNSILKDRRAPAIQLSCRDSAAGLSLRGLSGAPVLVGEPKKAIGVVRWNPRRSDTPSLAAGASIYAAPAKEILNKWPQLDTSEPEERVKLDATFARLLTDLSGRRQNDILRDIAAFLLGANIGINPEDLRTSEGDRPSAAVRIEIDSAHAVIEIVSDVSADEYLRQAERRLSRYLISRSRSGYGEYIGVISDGKTWHAYHRLNEKLTRVDRATLTIDSTGATPEQLCIWLEGLLATDQQLAPTPAEVTYKLGARSPSYAIYSAELFSIYRKHRRSPAVKVKRDMWANLLTTAAGTNFTNDDALFVDHTLLVVMAEIIGHSVIGFQPDDPAISAEAILSGELFSKAQIGGVIEADFFDWIAHVPNGDRYVKSLVKRIARFDWGSVAHDVLKTLYESIIPQETRHQLGEYYTPDWLAEEILAHRVTDPLSQRVLDASCGSGTFLFYAVRAYIDAADEVNMPDSQIVQTIGQHVIGFDVHPVAVTLARVTYLLAIGMERLQRSDRPAFAIPVYLADSLRWGKETHLWSRDGLSVPTKLDHQTFLNDPDFVAPSADTPNLDFPDTIVANADRFDRLVSELANLATARVRNAPVPKLAATFKRFEITNKAEQATVLQTFKSMCILHDSDRDHIWGYYLRNLARPVWLARPENRVDVLVGNPPWLAYRYMTQLQKTSFRAMSDERGLWTGASVATHQDLSALFVARSVEQYLRPGGSFGFVMPLGTLSRQQYRGFRSGRYSTSSEEVSVRFDQPWDLHGIKPPFFPQSVGVVFGQRQERGAMAAALTLTAEIWTGKFFTKTASLREARPHIVRTVGETSETKAGSAYMHHFTQGAAIVPRLLFVVNQVDAGPLGAGANRTSVSSKRSSFEKKPWKELPSLSGTVESKFIRNLYLGESLLPFRILSPTSAVIPCIGKELFDDNDDRIDLYPGLARWWRSAETTWSSYRSNDNLSLIQQLDYRHKLTRQLSTSKLRVIYNKSGMYLTSGIVTDPEAIIDQQLYWGEFADLHEARFLTAILNSTILTMELRPLQARGEHNPRHFDKLVFQMSIPRYDSANPAHRRLAVLAEQAERISSNVPLRRIRFEALRRQVRAKLVECGVSVEIDAIVKKILN